MKRQYIPFVILTLLIVACSSPSEVSPTIPPPSATPIEATASPTAQPTFFPTDSPPPTNTPEPTLPPATATQASASTAAPESEPVSFSGLPLPTNRGTLFAGSGVCAVCHTKMVDASGTDVSNDSYWRSTMMANAARDPYWRASVRREVLSNPEYGPIIEDKCSTCHMGMARSTVAAQGGQGTLFEFYQPENDLHALALDGVSCTLCHQIQATDLGQPHNFSILK